MYFENGSMHFEKLPRVTDNEETALIGILV